MMLAQVAPVAGTGTIAEYLQFGAAGVLAVVIAWLLKQASAREKLHADTVSSIGASVKEGSTAMAEAARVSAERTAEALAGVTAAIGSFRRTLAVTSVQYQLACRFLPNQPAAGKGVITPQQIADAAREAIEPYEFERR